ncbi:unnamed protein product [Rotaria sordida]|uniref:Uncharacterized protein n=1 Tax=Rotaria sordida TaxID=392033 RepID=A0A814EE12_9BILA|nr:unnamed protein product [Rotaria sordida]
MALQLTLSCDSDKIESGSTLIHSTGVPGYKIPPEIIRILQDNLTNDLLSDNEQGVLCRANSQRILDILRQNGFTLQNQTNEDDRTLWIVVKGSGDNNEQPVNPQDPNDGNDGNADGGDEAENKEEEEEGGGEEDEEQEQEE